MRRAGSQPPRGLGPSHTRLITSQPRSCARGLTPSCSGGVRGHGRGLPVPGAGWARRVGPAGLGPPGWACRVGPAGLGLPGWACRVGPAGLGLPGWARRVGPAGCWARRVLGPPGWGRRAGAAGLGPPGWGRQAGPAGLGPRGTLPPRAHWSHGHLQSLAFSPRARGWRRSCAQTAVSRRRDRPRAGTCAETAARATLSAHVRQRARGARAWLLRMCAETAMGPAFSAHIRP